MSFRLYGAGDELPPVIGRPLAASAEFETGALLVVNAAGAYAECGANPALVAATSLGPCGVGVAPLFALGVREFPPGEMIGVLVHNQTFTCEYVGTVGTILTAYGVTRGADSIWRLDFAKTAGDARVVFLGLVPEVGTAINRARCRFVAANVQLV